jgi:hypothetical protein
LAHNSYKDCILSLDHISQSMEYASHNPVCSDHTSKLSPTPALTCTFVTRDAVWVVTMQAPNHRLAKCRPLVKTLILQSWNQHNYLNHTEHPFLFLH